MPIRSIDYQTIIPKASEVQKMKHAESQNPQNHDSINMQKQQQQYAKDLKKVNETKKAFEGKIKRDNPRKQQGNGKDQDSEQQKKKKQENNQSIDVRI
ncbi:MAG: hypothetical protein K0Q99_2304 [Clostridia bacterium]|jgi:hypothetical protein|nr:hypothetical protein [Clostridia bacterium]